MDGSSGGEYDVEERKRGWGFHFWMSWLGVCWSLVLSSLLFLKGLELVYGGLDPKLACGAALFAVEEAGVMR